jgi:hypothetical protein
MRDEVTGECRLQHNVEPYDRYSSPNTVEAIISRRMRWGGNVAHTGDRTMLTGFWWGDLMEGDHLEDLGMDERIILK